MKMQMRRFSTLAIGLGLLVWGGELRAQNPATTFQPVAVTGFNQDVVAEANVGLGAKDATTISIDGAPNVAYTQGFATEFQFGGGYEYIFDWTTYTGSYVYEPYPTYGDPPGGLPDNGTVSNGRYNFQFADYGGNNVLFMSDLTGSVVGAVKTGTLTFATPSSNIWYSAAIVSTEGYSQLQATFNFTDGTTATTPTSPQISDWFDYGSTNGLDVLLPQIGRVGWTSPTAIHDGQGEYDWSGPQSTEWGQTDMLAWNFMVPCGSQGKTVKSITFNYITGGSGNHRCSIFGLASYGTASTPVFAPDVLPARCGNQNGIAAVDYKSGGTSPFTYSWDVPGNPTGATLTGLDSGVYVCHVADSNGCKYSFNDTVKWVIAPNLTAKAVPATVCEGTATTLSVAADTVEPIVYTWSPSATTGSSVSVIPDANTTYTVTGTDFYGCVSSATVSVAVTPAATASFTVAPTTVCTTKDQTVTYTGTAGSGATFNWNDFAGAAVSSGTGAGPYTIDFTTPGTYDVVLAVSENGCTTTDTVAVTVNGTGGSPVVTVQSVTTNTVTFSWAPVAGATGYQVSVNGGPYADPSSGLTGTTQVVTGLDPNTPVSISVIALGGNSCDASVAGTANGKTFDDAVFIPSAFTPNGDGKNDVFKIYSNQASAIEFKIFNQWGQQIWSTTNVNDGWDGTSNGKPQPSGVYIYAVRVTLLDGTQSMRKGSVSLVR